MQSVEGVRSARYMLAITAENVTAWPLMVAARI